MLKLFCAIQLCLLIHLLAIAAASLSLRIKLRAFVFGQGPLLFQYRLFQLKALPIGGNVSFLDTRSVDVASEEMKYAFDQRSTGEQILVTLSGCLVLLLMGKILNPILTIPGLTASFLQIFMGSILPLSDAQTLIAASLRFADQADFATLLGLVAIKLAAFNLLPLPALNGGAAIATAARQLGLLKYWPDHAMKLLIFTSVAVYCSWIIALVVYAFQHLF